MKLRIDTNEGTLTIEEDGKSRTWGLYTPEAFKAISDQWIKIGWDQKYVYTFTWLGRPIIQLPEDLIRVQEAIYCTRPDVIIETGVAHGGSLIFYACLCKAIGRGRVIGIDIEIRPRNREAIQAHELFSLLTLVEGDSIAPEVIDQVRGLVRPGERVFVVLDSSHAKQHVLQELEAYHVLVTPGSYIVATDGIMHDLHDVPRGKPEWQWDNPLAAALEFVSKHPEFVLEPPAWSFNESPLAEGVTHWPGAWLRRR